MKVATRFYETEALTELVKDFSDEMTGKLYREYYDEGKKGWDDPEKISDAKLKEMLIDNLEKGKWVNVANLAAMLWNREQPDPKPEEDE